MSQRYLVRVTLTDGSVVKGGGYQSRESACHRARSWVSDATFRSREANGALPVIAATVTFAGEVVAGFGTVGELTAFRP